MKNFWLKVYHRLPYALKVAAATLHGYSLKRWRYGAEMDTLMAEALSRESWSAEQWRSWQDKRLALVLHRAATRVPYYRNQWSERRRRGDRASWDNLENWPILEKEPLWAQPRTFVADDCDPARLQCLHTSGTTGKPLTLWQSRDTMRQWYALCEARWLRWYGVSRQNRWAILGGRLVAPVENSRPPFWVWNLALKQLYMSSYHLAPGLIPFYLDALKRYRIKYLWGYSSSLHALAQEALRLGRKDLSMTVAIANAEPLYDYQRRTIGEAFQCPVMETYGMTEKVAAASECQAGRLHLWPEVGIVEVFEEGSAVLPGQSGDLVITGLVNADMPLIRYRVGDRGALPEKATPCPCGRSLPTLGPVEGRCDDVLLTSDGRRIGRLDPVFKADLPIREAQIIQESFTKITVLYVPSEDFTPAAGKIIIDEVRARLGEVEVSLKAVEQVPRGSGGKFRAVVSKLAE